MKIGDTVKIKSRGIFGKAIAFDSHSDPATLIYKEGTSEIETRGPVLDWVDVEYKDENGVVRSDWVLKTDLIEPKWS